MADPVTGTGAASSEFKLTKLIVWIGVGVTILSAFAGALQAALAAQGVSVGWLPKALTIILAVAGMVTPLVKSLGYTAGRNTLKGAELAAKGAVEVAQLLPLFQSLVQLVKDLKEDPSSASPAPVSVLPAGLPLPSTPPSP